MGLEHFKEEAEEYNVKIEEILTALGFSNEMLGTTYCRYALLYILGANNIKVSMTKEVYPYVGRLFRVNAVTVERNIRVVIEKVWMRQELEKLEEYYPYVWDKNSGRPTNSEFIYNIAAKVLKLGKCR